MLHLAEPTDAGWYDRIADDLDLILVDHAHLEKRAASTALSMIFRYTDRPGLPRALGEVVAEETDHFLQMLDVLAARGLELHRLEPATYAATLVKHVRRPEPHTLLDKLLVAALIEARSCERFQILCERVEDSALAEFYKDLFEQEARHYTVYTDLARQYFGWETTVSRLDELAKAEVDALRASADQPRLHCW